jgi:predicted Zn-dependent protease
MPMASTQASSDLPSLGDSSSRLVSPQMEQQIGQMFLKQLHATLPISKDVLIQYYVEQHMWALAQYSDLQSALNTVIVVDNQSINAFAAPGGIIGINLGLLIYAQDSDEYSSVMAHEMAHLSQRHFARGVEANQASAIPNLVGLLAAVLVGAAGGTDAALAALTTAQAIGQSKQLRFSREREQEADRIGLNTLARASRDPEAMSRMFERMQQAYRFTRRPPEFLLTHPLSESRINDARNQARQFENRITGQESPALIRDKIDYQLIRARAREHYVVNPQKNIERYRKELAQSPNDVAIAYALALSLSKSEMHDEAIALIEQIYKRNTGSILYTGALGEILINADRHIEAQRLLASTLELYPENHPLEMLLVRSKIATKDFTDAETLLVKQSKLRPNDVNIWYELAETSGLAGNVTGVHLARAEYFYLNGAFHRAIQHLEYAQRLVDDANFQLEAKLTQRIQDLRTQIYRANS